MHPLTYRAVFLVSLLTSITFNLRAQYSPSEAASVQLSATVQSSPPRITLTWSAFPSATGYTVYRKLRTATTWGVAIANPTATATSYQDNTPTLNTVYEYKVIRTSSLATGYGYLCSGIEVQPTDYQGKMVLLVDNTLSTGLVNEIAQLESDLKADGWITIKHEVSPTASVNSVRTLVIGSYNADPTNVKAVYIIGHVPVPYSGSLAPDGHTDSHLGAWPCDNYYGELTSTWTDNTVNETSGWPSNDNVAGDGKFDQNNFPSSVELQVGRVDLGDMPAFTNTHTQRLSAYLTKAHQFKSKGFTPQVRGIIYDDLQDVVTPLGGSGWMSIAPLVGYANITEATPNQNVWLKDLVNDQSYLWTYGSGGGLVGDDNGVIMFNYLNKNAATVDLAGGVQWGGVFNMCMGSYVGDWNCRNNEMRAVLCSGKALTHVFSGQPNYFFHTMGMGENIGKALRLSVNNTTLYIPQSGSDVTPAPRCAMGLLGDPSLKLFSISAPSGLSVTNNSGTASFTWIVAEGNPAGYHVYKFNASGVPVRLNTTPIVGNAYASSDPFVAGTQYMVRAVKLETTASGSYYNVSLGAFAIAGVTVALAADVLLEGPYDSGTGLMGDDLRAAGFVPLTEPYTALGYAQVASGGGETTTAGVLSTTGANAIVDWVRVELRSAVTPSQVMASRQGLVQRDGDIVGTDGTSPLSFNVGAGNYHVAIRHRNHLGAMTAAPLALSANSTNLEFDNPATALYGTAAMRTVGAVRVLWMGNAGGGNALKYTGIGNDRDPILTRVGGTTPTNTVAGYFMEDCTLNGVVQYVGAENDRDPILLNIGGTVPTNSLLEQLP
jgi:hypothetical protein